MTEKNRDPRPRSKGSAGTQVLTPKGQASPQIKGAWLTFAVTGAVYLAALMFWRSTVPPGLGNDAAEEALRGIMLIQSHRFEAITFSLGNSAETLYLYLMGLMTVALGPTTLAIQLLSAIFAVICVWLVCLVVRQIDKNAPLWLPIALTTSSIWLFHYGRSGLRAILAPVFALGFVLLVSVAERNNRRRPSAIALAGAVVGLSIYSYTSCRILPIAAIVYMVIRLVSVKDRRALLPSYGLFWLAAGIVSIPNILFFLKSPSEFLFRGEYVLSKAEASIPWNLVSSFLLPFSYLDRYRVLSSLPTPDPTFDVDGFSATLMAPGFNPIHPLVGILIIIGLVKAWRLRSEHKACLTLLASIWVVGTLVLGIAGPSLTRFLILLPIYLVFAALAFAPTQTSRKRWTTHPLAIALLLVVFVGSTYSYFFEFRSSSETQFWYGRVATPLGIRGHELAREGKRVLCVVTKDVNEVRYLTYPESNLVTLVEFHDRPFVEGELSGFLPATDVILVENNARFGDWFRTRYRRSNPPEQTLFEEFETTR